MLPLRDRLPTRTTPVVNYLLLATNLLVFLGERSVIGEGLPPQLLLQDYGGLVPLRFVHDPAGQAFTVFTSMFMHDPSSWLHLGGNLLFLWIFGDNVEDAVGHLRYLAFFLLCGVAAAAAQILMDPSSRVPMIGASGAIAGVLAAYVSLYPWAPVTVVNPIPLLWLFFGLLLEVPAWVVILEFFGLNLWYAFTTHVAAGGAGGVAFFAHLGGFIAGLFLIRAFLAGSSPRHHERWQRWRPPSAPRPRGPRAYPPRARGPWD